MVSIGTAYVDVQPEVDSRGFGDSIANDIERSASGPLSGVGRRLGGIVSSGLLAAAAIGIAIVPAAQLIGSSIQSASDLGETMSKTNAVFGDASQSLIDYAATAAQSTGQSKRAFLDYTSSYGLLLKEIGGATDQQAADQATRLAGLTSDLSSFFNRSTSDVSAAISSGLTGEFESLKSFGVVINDARLQQKALELGIGDGTTALTAQQKQLATMELIYESTTDAQGDFARTSDGLANQQRILSAQWENAKATLGQAFLPIAVKVANFLSANLPRAIEIAGKVIGPLVGMFSTLAEAMGPVVGAAKQLIGALFTGDFKGGILEEDSKLVGAVFRIREAISSVVAVVGPLIGQLVAGFKALFTGFTEDEGTPVELFFLRIRETIKQFVDFMTGTVIPAIVGFVRTFMAIWADIGPDVISTFGQIASIVGSVLELVMAIVRRFVQVVGFIWSRWGDEIVAVLTVAWDLVSGVVSGALDIVQGIIRTVTAVINGDWAEAWEGIKQIFSGAWEIIKSVAVAAWEAIPAIIGLGMEALKALINWDNIIALASLAWDGIKALIGLAWEGIKTVIGNAIDSAKTRLSDGWNSIKTTASDAWEGLKTTVKDAVNWVVDQVKGLPDRLASAARNMWDGLVDGLAPVVNRAIDLINTLIGAYNAIPGIPDVSTLRRISTGPVIRPLKPVRMATGGLANEPILAIVGDNRGARYDPEVIAPTSHMIDAMMTALERTGTPASGPGQGYAGTVNNYFPDTSPEAIARALARQAHLRRSSLAAV